ncbi:MULTISPECIES: winged helix-turn-helix domain-containing protein [Vibrio]|uniref:winged helix-turn-helix domain-containing protein n=1 Tax=Vibrio TaxID=662 RepID=UPI0006397B5E|nr:MULTISPECIES: helix-turn-helix domain-containing protein [Vibrio]MBE8574555.1 winged helix-turn-helix domain-containing protein [Vibrio sp. OPT18]MCK8085358.1 helix-turn-helix domain-containing protein [Vibrio sp. 1CM8B]CDT90456.1 Hypothetical protein VCR3J2_350092 [Vibrio coralliirubri]
MSFYLLNQNLLFNSQSGKLLNLTSLQETQLRSNEWKLLSLFIEHSGSDLTSAFILEAIWESTRAKSSVATAVKNLRAQLGDSSEQPKFIQTQVMKGYAYIGETQALTEAEYQSLITRHASLWSKTASWVQHNKTFFIHNLIRFACVLFIGWNLVGLYHNGAFSRLVTEPTIAPPIPMLIHQNAETPSDHDIQICQSLLIEAQQSALFDTLPLHRESSAPTLPRLFWRDHNKEVLVCHLSPLK